MSARGAGNPPCGTVVDNKVTLNERFDFFLVSQKVTQGTVSPTSYNVIEDDTGIAPDIHQRLAYALTHLYYNWPVRFYLLFYGDLRLTNLFILGNATYSSANPVCAQVGVSCW